MLNSTFEVSRTKQVDCDFSFIFYFFVGIVFHVPDTNYIHTRREETNEISSWCLESWSICIYSYLTLPDDVPPWRQLIGIEILLHDHVYSLPFRIKNSMSMCIGRLLQPTTG
jgi:hypothetical protein